MKVIMAKQKIPANIERLFDYDKSLGCQKNPREYNFYDFEGNKRTIVLSYKDKLSRTQRCPVDGVRMIIYSGDPHNVIECPNCGNHPKDYQYSEKLRENDLEKISEKIKRIEIELEKLKFTRQILGNPNHPIVNANLRDEAMNE